MSERGMNDKSQPIGDVCGSPGAMGVGRRSFLVSALATGFALAVRPTWSATIVLIPQGSRQVRFGFPPTRVKSQGIEPCRRKGGRFRQAWLFKKFSAFPTL